MSFFKDADTIDLAIIAKEYEKINREVMHENLVLRIQLRQHTEREKELLEILKEKIPEFYEVLKKGDEKNDNTES
ncbi:MAG: hypothetical protein N4Q79_06010 [Lactobacillus iners]|jgi:hypothetical protein|uniref:hypothetical protein n=1 Tax=Lactobacillus iners TaxID=147802 RepID=UPI0001E9C063|nr:hypothetical protein [Lactobacillus iners]MCT7824420.1 hypothetical protein [Lactobacillus crispatus]DAK92888.1 MAG TPA: hypothetical protein [Caudoviricetes sp.]EFQ50500.1 hypothetical protein HMPREF9218_0105 [Lactobacillus iners LEAF 2062A-h1]MCT7764476.1 hypothetical protein [Lactobacillus iners]MCT7775452.1 hypothetical protein [Lactobacillus iners]